MKYIFVLSFLVPLASFAAPKKIDKTLEANKAHEECMTLTPEQELSYAFKSTTDVKFNLHYHVGKEVFYPVKHDKTAEQKGNFKPRIKQDYCLMWANKSESPIKVSYEFEVK